MVEESEYDLQNSIKGLGKLVPILKDAHGNVIDGFHRQKIDADWPSVTVGTVDNPEKLALARLASNFCRRKVPDQELHESLVFLVGKCGMKAEEIANATGISVRTIYRHMPQDMKKPEAQAISVGMKEKSQLTPVSSSIKIQDMVECERCHTSTSEPKEWHGHQLCDTHFKGAQLNPEFYERFFGYLDKAKKGEVPPLNHALVKGACDVLNGSPETKPKPLEKWSDREAKMHPLHSKTEENVLAILVTKGVRNIAQDRHFCVRETVPDFYFPEKET